MRSNGTTKLNDEIESGQKSGNNTFDENIKLRQDQGYQ